MSMYEYIKDSEKVLRRKPSKQFITEPVERPEKVIAIHIDYNKYFKNDLVRMLCARGIDHNKRQLKEELVALLEQDDNKNI